jgi:hypothetical protein
MKQGSVALILCRATTAPSASSRSAAAIPHRFTSDLAADFLAHLGVIVAISLENAVNRARLVRSGVTDFLTGWHNRRYFHNRLREELARSERTGQDAGLSHDRRRQLQGDQRPLRTPRR